MSDKSNGHIMKRFDGELSHLHLLVMEMGGLVIDQITRAINALDEEDAQAAREIISRDRIINDLDIKIDEEVLRLLAVRQPMATDLRNVMTVVKSVTDLERMGDEVRKLAALVERCYDTSASAPNAGVIQDVRGIAEYGRGMVRRVLEAFDQLDMDKAIEVLEQDAKIEDKFRSALRRLSTFLMEDSRNVGHAIEAVLGLRALERIGGHAKNIAGHVIFLTTGQDVRHADLEEILRKVAERR